MNWIDSFIAPTHGIDMDADVSGLLADVSGSLPSAEVEVNDDPAATQSDQVTEVGTPTVQQLQETHFTPASTNTPSDNSYFTSHDRNLNVNSHPT